MPPHKPVPLVLLTGPYISGQFAHTHTHTHTHSGAGIEHSIWCAWQCHNKPVLLALLEGPPGGRAAHRAAQNWHTAFGAHDNAILAAAAAAAGAYPAPPNL
eukprot:1161514-Pelagomonas_calceolata.AAC.3